MFAVLLLQHEPLGGPFKLRMYKMFFQCMAFTYDSAVWENLQRGRNIPIDPSRFFIGLEL